MDTFIALEASTELPRNQAIPPVLAALVADGGFVTDTRTLGGLALLLRIELNHNAASGLDTRLRAAGAALDRDSRALLEDAYDHTDDDDSLVGSLLLRFYAQEPDLKVTIPRVPG